MTMGSVSRTRSAPRTLRVLQQVWPVGGAVLLCGLVWGIALWSIGGQVGRPFPGFLYNPSRVVSGFTPPDFTGPQAGLRPWDQIVAVNGRHWRQMPRLVQEAGIGGTLIYTVERAGQRVDVAVPTMEFTPGIMSRFLPSYFVSSFIFVAIGVFVYLRSPGERLNRYLLAYLLVWAIGGGVVWESYLSQQKWMAYLLAPYAVTAPVAGWVFFWNFPADRTRRRFLARWPLIQAIVALGAGAVLTMLAVRVLADAFDRQGLWHLLVWLEGWPYYITFALGSLPMKILPLVEIAMRNRARLVRQQAITMIVGLVIGLAGWYAFIWTPAAIHTRPAADTPWGGLIPAVYPLSVGYAVLRYQLFDIRVVVRKGLVYSLLTATLTAVFVLLALVTGRVFQALTGQPSFLVMLFPALLVAFLFQPVRERIQSFVDRAFFRQEYEERLAVTAFSRGLATLRERGEVVRLVCDTVKETLGAAEADLWLPGRDCYWAAVAGAERGPIADGPLVAWLELEQRPLRLRPEEAFPAAEALQRVGMALAVPLPLGGRLLGILMLGEKRSGEPYTDADLELLAALGSSAALALENARLHEERVAILREQFMQVAAVQEEERRRIARELHDGVGPSLASLRIRLRTVHKLLDRQQSPLAAEVQELADQAQANIRDIRRLIYDLRPAALEFGLVAALREHVARYEQDQGIRVDLTVPSDTPPLAAVLEAALFRIAQEALANVARHARAARAHVALSCDGGHVTLSVADDGQGFDAEAVRDGDHLGLWSMQKRVEQFGGSFRVESRPGQGARITVTIPLQAAPGDAGRTGGGDGQDRRADRG